MFNKLFELYINKIGYHIIKVRKSTRIGHYTSNFVGHFIFKKKKKKTSKKYRIYRMAKSSDSRYEKKLISVSDPIPDPIIGPSLAIPTCMMQYRHG